MTTENGVAGRRRKPRSSVSGSEVFEEAATRDGVATDRVREALQWAKQLEREGKADLRSYVGIWTVLILAIPDERKGAGLASLYVSGGGALRVRLHRTVFARRAPSALAPVEAAAGGTVGAGSSHPWTLELRDALDAAYRELA